MNRILDLSVYKNDTFDITMVDGSVVNVKKPTQAIVIKLMELTEAQNAQSKDLLDLLVDATATLLSNNNEGKVFSKEWVSNNLDFTMIVAIIRGYTAFTEELQSNPI